jgi:hypothetical protein
MDDHFKKVLQVSASDLALARLDGVLPHLSPTDWTDSYRLDYLAARTAGLSMHQAEYAVRIAHEIRLSKLEPFLTRLSSPPHTPGRAPYKRRGKALKEEPDYKKKPKC